MSDPGLDDEMTDDEMMDPIEKKQLESLQQVVDALVQVVQGLQIIAQQNAQIVQVLLADRTVTSTARDGRQLTAISSVKHG